MHLSKNNHVKAASIILSLVLSLLLLLSNLFGYVNNSLLDRLFASSAPNQQVVVLAIDEASLDRFGQWPWDRSVWGRVATVLGESQVRTAVFDVIFAEATASDTEFISSIEKNTTTNFILAGKVITASDQVTQIFDKPLSEFQDLTNVEVAYANLPTDIDGIVRYADLREQIGKGCEYSLAARALSAHLFSPLSVECAGNLKFGFTELSEPDELRINYYGPKGTIRTISLVEFLDDSEAFDLQDSIVFVGTTVQDLKLGLDDNLISPVGLLPGVEIHAQLTSNLLADEYLYDLNPYLQVLVLIILIVFTVIIVLKPKHLITSGIFLLVLEVINFAVAAFAFGLGYVMNLFHTSVAILITWIVVAAARFYLQQMQNIELKRAFSQYVNEKLLSQIIDNPEKLKLGGVRKQLTILFSDIRGFTSLSESMTPDQLVEFLNSYLTDASDQIFKHNGVVDKYIGDAIMALWNAPLDDKSHAYNACQAALGMVWVLDQFNQESSGEDLKIGIGINTAEVAVGNMGSQRRFDYTAMGDGVNLASRLEGLTKHYGVNIILGEDTVKRLELTGKLGQYSIRLIDKVQVKGRVDTVKIYELQGLRHDKYSQLNNQFARAFDLYVRGEFEDAKTKFEHVLKLHDDDVSKLFVSRCELLMSSAPTEWHGVWKWETK